MATVKCALGERGRPSHEWNDGEKTASTASVGLTP